MVRRDRLLLCPLVVLAGCVTEPWQKEMPPASGATPLAFGWSDTAGWPDRAHDVYGLRLGISSRHHSVVGLDVNGIGVTDAMSGGLAFAFARNEARDGFIGAQVALGWNIVTPLSPENAPNKLWGAQVALGINFADVNGLQVGGWNGMPHTHDDDGSTVRGAQFGLFDGAGDLCGLQCAALTAWADTAYGVQVAPWNVAEHVYGLQVGLFNVATKGGGLQVGLLNWNKSGILPVLPLLNFSVR
jgi:hypothetical protein